ETDGGAQDRDEPRGEDRLDDAGDGVLRRGGGRARRERTLLPQDPAVELLQLAPRLDSELVVERRAEVEVRLRRLRLPSRAVEREHQLSAQALAQRVLCDERFELRHEADVEPGLELGLDAVFDRVQPELLEPPDLALRERLVGHVRQRWPAPELERAPQPP